MAKVTNGSPKIGFRSGQFAELGSTPGLQNIEVSQKWECEICGETIRFPIQAHTTEISVEHDARPVNPWDPEAREVAIRPRYKAQIELHLDSINGEKMPGYFDELLKRHVVLCDQCDTKRKANDDD